MLRVDEDVKATLQTILFMCIQEYPMFSQPADIELSIDPRDYEKKIAEPMNLSMLNNHVCFGRYTFFYQFLRDLSLIFSNSRIWSSEQDSLSLTKQTENYVLRQLSQCKGLHFTKDAYLFITHNIELFDSLPHPDPPAPFPIQDAWRIPALVESMTDEQVLRLRQMLQLPEEGTIDLTRPENVVRVMAAIREITGE